MGLKMLALPGIQASRVLKKGKGRSKTYHPPPRQRFPIVKKAKTALDKAATIF
jgi:hypothetical protein